MSALSALIQIEFLATEQDMSDASIFERIIVFSWILLAVTGGLNGIYICFHGIRQLDPYFSTKPNVEWESHSPFDSFCRMHRYSFQYSFGLKRPAIGNGTAVWLYFTCISLIIYYQHVYWLSWPSVWNKYIELRLPP